MKNFTRLSILFSFLPLLLLAQGPGTAAVPFLMIGPSPGLGGSQGANTVLPSDGTYAFYYNPAQLGVFSRDNNISYQFYPQKMNWLPGFNFDDVILTSQAFTGGYILKDIFDGTDLNVGMGYLRTVLNLGENVITDTNGDVLGTFNSSENYNAFSVGIGFEYYAYFSIGYTYKNITSKLAPLIIGPRSKSFTGKASGNAHDFGLMIEIPLLKSHLKNSEDAIHLDKKISLFSDAYLGYAVRNFGDFIDYGEKRYADPLPKTANLGIGFSMGVEQELEFTSIKLLEFKFAREAQDLLVGYNSKSGNKYYQSGLGDIDFADNIISGNSNELVQVNQSFLINIAESVYLGFHKMKGPGYPEYVYNSSVVVSSRGLFKLFFNPEENDPLNNFFSYVDLKYAESNINSGKGSPLNGTGYSGFSITLHGLF
jgi:hypothetical protein